MGTIYIVCNTEAQFLSKTMVLFIYSSDDVGKVVEAPISVTAFVKTDVPINGIVLFVLAEPCFIFPHVLFPLFRRSVYIGQSENKAHQTAFQYIRHHQRHLIRRDPFSAGALPFHRANTAEAVLPAHGCRSALSDSP